MRPEVVFGIQRSGIDSVESRRGTPHPVPGDSTSSTSIPAAAENRMYAIAMRPDVGSIPIAGRSAFRPRVTAAGALHVVPSLDEDTKSALVVAPGAAQSCQAIHTRPAWSTSAEGSGKPRQPRTAHDA